MRRPWFPPRMLRETPPPAAYEATPQFARRTSEPCSPAFGGLRGASVVDVTLPHPVWGQGRCWLGRLLLPACPRRKEFFSFPCIKSYLFFHTICPSNLGEMSASLLRVRLPLSLTASTPGSGAG